MIRIVINQLVCDMKGHGVGQRLIGTEVAGVARVRTTGHNQSQSVALAVKISGGPEFDVYVAGPVIQGAGTVGANPDIPIADVRGTPVRSNVAQDQKEIGVFQAGAKKQLSGHGADDFDTGREGLSGE